MHLVVLMLHEGMATGTLTRDEFSEAVKRFRAEAPADDQIVPWLFKIVPAATPHLIQAVYARRFWCLECLARFSGRDAGLLPVVQCPKCNGANVERDPIQLTQGMRQAVVAQTD